LEPLSTISHLAAENGWKEKLLAPVAGIDGCRGGWCAVIFRSTAPSEIPEIKVFAHLQDFYTTVPDLQRCLIDIPIGLPDATCPQRACDLAARRQLGRGLGSRVFSAPARQALQAENYQTACQRNLAATGRKISLQTYNICPKIRECDNFLESTPAARSVFRESHPEIVFQNLAGARPELSKKTKEGRTWRLQVIRRWHPALAEAYNLLYPAIRPFKVAPDDWLDAVILALRARLPCPLQTLPENPPTDASGLSMEIAY
jgi:predicted RNase H-like nuclease